MIWWCWTSWNARIAEVLQEIPFTSSKMFGFLRFLPQKLTSPLTHVFLSFFLANSLNFSLFSECTSLTKEPQPKNPYSLPLLPLLKPNSPSFSCRQNPLTHYSRCTLARFPSTMSPTIDFACGNRLVEM